jgi:hypothetical protein
VFELVGVKVTLSDCVPAPGTVVAFAKEKEPSTGVLFDEADPPVSNEVESAWP